MLSSTICSHFTQNAWKKDLCSNCFKSKDEHKTSMETTKELNVVNTDYPNKYKRPERSILKKLESGKSTLKKKIQNAVSFPQELDQVIGYGGEWPTIDSDDENDFMNFGHENGDDDIIITETDDEATLELNRITRANTDFNMNNGNLLGDAEENIKKTVGALKLGEPQIDKEGKKQTLKISVVPFGVPALVPVPSNNISVQAEQQKRTESAPVVKVTTVMEASQSATESTANQSGFDKQSIWDGTSSPPLELAMCKSLLDEISETLERKQLEQDKELATARAVSEDNATEGKQSQIPACIEKPSELEYKPFLDIKKPIARNTPITKDHAKPKVQISQKYSDAESNNSDNENGVSAYYDVVESLPELIQIKKDKGERNRKPKNDTKPTLFTTSSQNIADVLLSSKARGASYNLRKRNLITSKSTTVGSIVAKCNSDDAMDSTGSSFDGSSDEENAYNMIRSESDSGIGISIGIEYKLPLPVEIRAKPLDQLEKSTKSTANTSDYEDIQISKQQSLHMVSKQSGTFDLDKSRELHGEPDGSADPDNNLYSAEIKSPQADLRNLPSLPKSPPPTLTAPAIATLMGTATVTETITGTTTDLDARSSFLHGKKPELPAKPQVTGTSLKTFAPKPIAKSIAEFEGKPKQDTTISRQIVTPAMPEGATEENDVTRSSELIKINTDSSATPAVVINSIYTRKPQQVGSTTQTSNNSSSPAVMREKDKRERAVLNPKFRSLNTFVMQRTNAAKNLQIQNAGSVFNLQQSLTPETRPKNPRNLSVSEECLAANVSKTKTKSKFSIKKFLRMGSSSSKAVENLHRKDSVYTEICTGDDTGIAGKPRLVIIHPIDINPTAVEVVKDITKSSGVVVAPIGRITASKPPLPPMRSFELNKPMRPPPPKSAELRRKQKIELAAMLSLSSTESAPALGSIKDKSDNVYANLGEIRSAIAPRKPERTASMREREAQLELARKRSMGSDFPRVESVTLNDTTSICSSNSGKSKSKEKSSAHEIKSVDATNTFRTQAKSNIQHNSMERKQNVYNRSISSKLEIFEQRTNPTANIENSRPSNLKDSVRKINSTIDSYLKDKSDFKNICEHLNSQVSPPKPAVRAATITTDLTAETILRNNLQRPGAMNAKRHNQQFSDTASIVSYTRSESGSTRNYSINNSFVNVPRLHSASYAGSDVGDMDIYSPYSYFGSETGGENTEDINDSVWGTPWTNKNRIRTTNRLRMRKGRSVVHRNIEDNYTAVVVANHEALAQVLDQLQQTPTILPALRPLANAMNLRYEDFTIIDGSQPFVVGRKAFHAAIWTTCPVTLAFSADCSQLAGVGGELMQLSGGVCDVLNPITEFCDLVPSYQLPEIAASKESPTHQAIISVLSRLQLESLQTIGAILKTKSEFLDKTNLNFRGSIPNLSGSKDSSNAALRNVVSVQDLNVFNEESKCPDATAMAVTLPPHTYDDIMTREVAFIMLQLINGMKNLQSKTIEEMPLSLSNVVLAKDVDNKEAQARLCVLQGNDGYTDDEPLGTLCKCAYIALNEILPVTKVTGLLGDILKQERAESLSKVKSVLEFVLWGPSDVILSGSTKDRELALQRWLDLERATVLHGLVRTRVELTIYDECHLMFLVRSTAKQMNDAAQIVCNYQQGIGGSANIE